MTGPANFNRYIRASEFGPLAAFLRGEGSLAEYPSGGLFATQGVRNRYCGLVEEGAFRYVLTTGRGERCVVGYSFCGEFVGDYISSRLGRAAWVGIEALCDSRVARVPYERLELFFGSDSAGERMGRRLAEHLLAEVYERLLQMYESTPQERYEALLRRCPGVLDLVELKELASYLHVRPETLSRIRARIR